MKATPLTVDQIEHLREQAASNSPTMNHKQLRSQVVVLCQQHLEMRERVRQMIERNQDDMK